MCCVRACRGGLPGDRPPAATAEQVVRGLWVPVAMPEPASAVAGALRRCTREPGPVLSAALVEAAADLRRMPAGDLHDQFVGWLSQYGPST
jgi:hypothetical protein